MSLRDLLGKIASAPPNTAAAKAVPAGEPAVVVPAGTAVAPATGAGAFGKAPVRADFVRVNAGGFSAAGFERWMEDGIEALHVAGVPVPDEPIDFFLVGPGGAPACLGVFAGSRDKVGRTFPLALFTYVDASLAEERSYLAECDASFLQAVRAALASLSSDESPADPAASVEALARLDPALVRAGAAAAAKELGEGSCHARLEAMFPPFEQPTTPGGLAGALATVLTACDSVRDRMPDRAALTLELPAFDARGVSFWLELLRVALRWPAGAPSWLWSRANARLLVALGPPTKDLLIELGRPDKPGARHWVIEAGAAAEAAEIKLPAGLRDVLARPAATVAEVWTAAGR